MGMVASITGLTTTGIQGDTFTLTGTGFGASDPGNALLVFQDVNRNFVDILSYVTSWTPTQITGELPLNLFTGEEGFFALQLVGESVGATSPTFTILGPIVIHTSDMPTNVMSSTVVVPATDINDVQVPTAEYAGTPVGYVVGSTSPGVYAVKYTSSVLSDDPTYEEHEMYQSEITVQGYLVEQTQKAMGSTTYLAPPRPEFEIL